MEVSNRWWKLCQFSAPLFIVLTLAGCATVPMADNGSDTIAKSFAPVVGKAVVYVYRNETLGAAIKMNIKVDDRPVVQSASKTYFRFVLEPGRHVIESQHGSSALEMDAEPGGVYYVWQEVKMGFWSGGSALHLVDAGKGQADVKECRLVQSDI